MQELTNIKKLLTLKIFKLKTNKFLSTSPSQFTFQVYFASVWPAQLFIIFTSVLFLFKEVFSQPLVYSKGTLKNLCTMCMLEAYFWFYAKLNINDGLALSSSYLNVFTPIFTSYHLRLQKADWKPKLGRFYLDVA